MTIFVYDPQKYARLRNPPLSLPVAFLLELNIPGVGAACATYNARGSCVCQPKMHPTAQRTLCDRQIFDQIEAGERQAVSLFMLLLLLFSLLLSSSLSLSAFVVSDVPSPLSSPPLMAPFPSDLVVVPGAGRHPRRTLEGTPRMGGREGNSNRRHNIRHNNNSNKHHKASSSGSTIRPYFDELETSGNITLIKGQTAMLQCTVRNVGNKSV